MRCKEIVMVDWSTLLHDWMGSESNDDHSDNLWNNKWNNILENTRCLFAPLSCPLILPAGCWVTCCRAALSSSCHAAILSSCLASRRLLIAPPSHYLIPQVHCCCVTSCRAAVLFSRCTALSSSHRLLTAPPSRHLITPSGCCITSRHAFVLSSCRPRQRCPLAVKLRRLVVVSPLVTSPSCLLVAPHSCPIVILSLRHPLVISLCHLVVVLHLVVPMSHPLVVLSLHHPLVVLCRLVAVLPLIAPPSCPLVALPSCPLVARWLVVVWPPSNTAAAIECFPPPTPLHAIFIVHRRHRRHLRHLHCRMLYPRALTKKEAAAPPPLVHQRQHHCKHVYKSRQLELI